MTTELLTDAEYIKEEKLEDGKVFATLRKAKEIFVIQDEHETPIAQIYIRDDNCICSLFVLPEYRRQGYARRLMENVIRTLGETTDLSLTVGAYADCNVPNDKLESFYESFGFFRYYVDEDDGTVWMYRNATNKVEDGN